MLTISLEHVRLFGRHGVFAQENAVGAEYDVWVDVSLPPVAACDTDALGDTISYAGLYELLATEFAEPSALLEHLTKRIAMSIASRWPQVEAVKVKVCKIAPPIPAFQGSASVTYTWRKPSAPNDPCIFISTRT